MSTTLTLTANKSAAVTKVWGSNNVHSGDIFNLPWYKFSDNTNYTYYDIFVGFASAAAAYRFKPITAGQLDVTFNGSNAIGRFYLFTLAESFSEDSVGLSFLVPSSSGLASLSSPIVSPIVAGMGWSVETAVMINVAANGLVNLFTPTCGFIMGGLALARVPYETWVKWAWKLLVTLFVVVGVILTIAMAVLS